MLCKCMPFQPKSRSSIWIFYPKNKAVVTNSPLLILDNNRHYIEVKKVIKGCVSPNRYLTLYRILTPA